MQLIEIIQFALIFFVAISVIIFLFSYLGYRKKSQENNLQKSIPVDKKVEIEKPIVAEKLNPLPEPEKPKEKKIVSPKFKVFTPETDSKIESEKSQSKKSHFPKTLTIKHKSKLN